MIIRNLRVFQPDGSFRHQDLYISHGRFITNKSDYEEVCSDTDQQPAEIKDTSRTPEQSVVDGQNLLAVPGFIDIHLHGCKHADFCDATKNSIQIMAAYEASQGVTSICPTSMTVSKHHLEAIMQNFCATKCPDGSHLAGIHMEGPFISQKRKGAQKEENVCTCDVRWFHHLQKLSGDQIKIVDIAPETPGAIDFIQKLHNDVCISLAHTDADYETAREALQLGARHVTHLYNAMPPFHHRHPGVIGAAFDEKNCRVELICDGIHLHPSVVRAAFAMFGADRIIFVSDSMEATGLEDGRYMLGGQDVYVDGRKAVLQDGTLAGSVTNLADCFRIAVKQMDIPIRDALWAVTRNPAKEIGIYNERGSIEAGKIADFLLLDDSLKLKAVFILGKRYL
ncbi:MAG: N-acetylglucosamine-6-phosphate deacetylase [Bilifractor sp.]|nr:N-acetylglucosamine-6-phosphate deacetylase [Eubacterium sp.]